MKNKNLRMKEKLYELSKKTVIYVLDLRPTRLCRRSRGRRGLRKTGLILFWANCTGGQMNHQRTF